MAARSYLYVGSPSDQDDDEKHIDDDVNRDEYYEGDDDNIEDGRIHSRILFMLDYSIKFYSPGLALDSEQKVWDGAQGTGVKMLKFYEESLTIKPFF